MDLNFLAQELGCPPDHQAGQEDAQDGEDDEVDEAHALAAEDHVQQHLRDGRDARARRQAVVHGIDRAGGEGCRRRHEERRLALTETHFVAFHVALGGADAQAGHDRVSGLLGEVGYRQEDEEEDTHHGEEGPGLLLLVQHDAQHVDERRRDGRHQDDLRARWRAGWGSRRDGPRWC